jgi:ribosome biogenesis GTPase A
LVQTSAYNGKSVSNEAADIDVDALAQQMGLDLVGLAEKKVICRRCHGLQNFGTVEKELRPGWTEEPMLSQEKFRDLLRPIRDNPAVIIALVDLFDFSGSVLPELDAIAGDNPVIIAANKADLLPTQMGQVRAENWVRRELEYLGTQSIANIGGAVRLVSCKTGFGIAGMLAKARGLAEEMDCDVYIVGAANAGKSTLINHILASNQDKVSLGSRGKIRAGNSNKVKGAVTTSPLPGTTLQFIKIDLGKGRSLYDTPGLLVNGTLTQLLTPEELKMVVPKK